MSLKAILEVTVLLQKLRNIDLCQQGLYQIHISAYCLKGSQRTNAQPVSFEVFSSLHTKPNLHNIVQGSINEESLKIKSRIFFIRFAEEKVKINEAATFYIEIDLKNTTIQPNLYVQVDLFHTEVSKKSIVENFRTFSYENSLKLVSSKKYRVSNPLKGIFEYFPICFSTQWFCSIDASLLIAFYDYKIPSSDMSLFTTILFSDKRGLCKTLIGGEEIDRKYSEYVSTLAQVHDNIRKTIEKISVNCFIEDIEIPRSLQLPVTFPNPNPEKSFAEHLSSHEPHQTAQDMLKEIKSIAASIYEAFNLMKIIMTAKPRKVVKYMRRGYSESLGKRYGEFVIKEVNKRWDFDICSIENTKVQHKGHVSNMRKSEYYKNLESLVVHEDNFFAKMSRQPIIFEEIYYAEDIEKEIIDPSMPITPEKRKNREKHLIVLVHGFQGNSYDLRMVHNYISLAFPHCYFLESSYNESKTEGDIREMGSRLSKELITYLTENFPDKPPSISFIGHSLGGLIIRAALPYLECLSDRMHLYMSLSSPHLGFMYSSKLLDAGMWILKKMKKFHCLKQLCLEDYHKIEGTCLYLLSKADGLQWFQYVVLVSSSQDDYAPFDSARIEVPEKASKDPEMGNYYIQMAHNLLQKLTMQNLIKLDIHFKLKKSIDTMIGRSAHLQLLENEHFLRMLVYHYPEFFA